MTLLDNILGLWWAAVWSSAATLLVVKWGWQGPRHFRSARFMLATSLLALAISYWWAIGWGLEPGQQEMRRGAGLVWFPSMCLVAWQAMRFARAQNRVAQATLDRVRSGAQPDGGYEQ